MEKNRFVGFDPAAVATPCFVTDKAALRGNCEVLARVKRETGCRILLALKAFALYPVFPLLKDYLDGTCASGPHEARLGREEFGGEVHGYAAAFSDADLAELLTLCDHIQFNSFSQWEHFKPFCLPHLGRVSFGLRINPEHSEAPAALYDPCAPNSRLGVRAIDFVGRDLSGLSGLHFHTLCEKNADALERTLAAVEEKLAPYLKNLRWVNFGGGHHITRSDYDVPLLVKLINGFRKRWNVDVILEPGEAVALNAGVLVASVLDVMRNGIDIAILDASATCHMPDVLEMPYRPEVHGADLPGVKPHSYRLAGPSCLAGDVVGDYSFDRPLKPGDRIVFKDMAHYTMVKTTTFNGMRLPSIALYDSETGSLETLRDFGYEDFRRRLS